MEEFALFDGGDSDISIYTCVGSGFVGWGGSAREELLGPSDDGWCLCTPIWYTVQYCRYRIGTWGINLRNHISTIKSSFAQSILKHSFRPSASRATRGKVLAKVQALSKHLDELSAWYLIQVNLSGIWAMIAQKPACLCVVLKHNYNQNSSRLLSAFNLVSQAFVDTSRVQLWIWKNHCSGSFFFPSGFKAWPYLTSVSNP